MHQTPETPRENEVLNLSNYEETVANHYSSRDVKEEIARFSKDRWVALHCELKDADGRPYLLRYKRVAKHKIPLTVSDDEGVPALLKRFGRLKPRTFYASANVYREINHSEHVRSFKNIVFCLPTWDIDNVVGKWEATIAAAKAIIDFLSNEGVSKSVFVKWSGNGTHVHVHHRSFSTSLLQRIKPLDAAYAIVEYVNSRLRSQFLKIAKNYKARELKVQNEMDLQRVFTCPLSLHRSLDLVAICLPPDKVNSFSPKWASREHYRHWKGWDRFETGEADGLAETAHEIVGGYPLRMSKPLTGKRKSTTEPITRWLKEEK